MFNKLPKHPLTNYYLALIGSYILWAAAGPIIKMTLDYVPPFTALLLRFIIVCTIMLPYIILRLKRESILPEDYTTIFLTGILSQSSLLICFLGFKYTSALEATLIGLLATILSIAAGHYYYHEKTNLYVKIGIIVAALGTLFVAIEPIINPAYSTHSVNLRIFGNSLIIIYNVMFLVYIIWSKLIMGEKSAELKRTLKLIHIKPMRKKYSPILITIITFYVGLLTFIPMAYMELSGVFGPVSFDFATITIKPVLGIIYLALFSSIAAYLLFEWSLTKVEIKDTGLFSYMHPIFTVPFAYLLLKEIPNVYMIIGSIIIALGVVIAEYKKS